MLHRVSYNDKTLDMRKFIVQNFALNHISVVLGKTINWVKLGNWAIPSMCVGGLYSIYSDANFYSFIGVLILAFIVLQNLIVLVYFRIKPVRWDELTLSQKWQYGQSYFSQQLTKELPNTEVKKILSEWSYIDTEFKSQLEGKRFYNLGAFLVVPVTVLVTVLIVLGWF